MALTTILCAVGQQPYTYELMGMAQWRVFFPTVVSPQQVASAGGAAVGYPFFNTLVQYVPVSHYNEGSSKRGCTSLVGTSCLAS